MLQERPAKQPYCMAGQWPWPLRKCWAEICRCRSEGTSCQLIYPRHGILIIHALPNIKWQRPVKQHTLHGVAIINFDPPKYLHVEANIDPPDDYVSVWYNMIVSCQLTTIYYDQYFWSIQPLPNDWHLSFIFPTSQAVPFVSCSRRRHDWYPGGLSSLTSGMTHTTMDFTLLPSTHCTPAYGAPVP